MVLSIWNVQEIWVSPHPFRPNLSQNVCQWVGISIHRRANSPQTLDVTHATSDLFACLLQLRARCDLADTLPTEEKDKLEGICVRNCKQIADCQWCRGNWWRQEWPWEKARCCLWFVICFWLAWIICTVWHSHTLSDVRKCHWSGDQEEERCERTRKHCSIRAGSDKLPSFSSRSHFDILWPPLTSFIQRQEWKDSTMTRPRVAQGMRLNVGTIYLR